MVFGYWNEINMFNFVENVMLIWYCVWFVLCKGLDYDVESVLFCKF